VSKVLQSQQDGVLFVSEASNQYKLLIDSILYIAMTAHYADAHTGKAMYRIRIPAIELMEFLPDYFLRCHRSYIINLLKVERVCRDSLLLSNGMELPISRNNVRYVKDAFMRAHTEH